MDNLFGQPLPMVREGCQTATKDVLTSSRIEVLPVMHTCLLHSILMRFWPPILPMGSARAVERYAKRNTDIFGIARSVRRCVRIQHQPPCSSCASGITSLRYWALAYTSHESSPHLTASARTPKSIFLLLERVSVLVIWEAKYISSRRDCGRAT
jgi:hypothetical protein